MSFKPVLSDSEIGQLKTQLRSMKKRRDEIAINIAKILNFPNIWTMAMVDWNNPEVSHFKEEYQQLDHNINWLSWEIEEAEAIRDGTIDYFNAKVKAYGFIHDNFHSLQEEADFFAKNSLVRGMSSLIEAIYMNPDYLEEVIL